MYACGSSTTNLHLVTKGLHLTLTAIIEADAIGFLQSCETKSEMESLEVITHVAIINLFL